MATKTENNGSLERRVLVLMPTGRDAKLVCAALVKSGIEAQACRDAGELEESAMAGAGAILVAEEALQDRILENLIRAFNRQPIWSDIPVVLFAGGDTHAETLLTRVGSHLNATIVERPIRITMLVSAVRGALRAREKQYQTRDLLNRLEESDRQKDLFLATLSHELRTPLNSVLGWVRLLRQESDKRIDKQHALEVIERNARAQSEMISDILFVSRVITGKLTLNKKPVDMISVIEATIDAVEPLLKAKNIRLESVFEIKTAIVESDPVRLQQMFGNLFSNAIKFTPHKGRIDVRVSSDGANFVIEIKDSGQGIKAEFLPFVFERFRQSDSSYTREVGGLGLGLAIVHHLVGLHDGTVTAASGGENLGATFIITLPAANLSAPPVSEEENQFAAAPLRKQDSLPGGTHLLIIEDDADSREMLRVMFAQHDIKITAAATAAEGFETIKKTQPDILISDVGLPGEDGYSLIRKVRALAPEKGGQISAIALTGYASLQDRGRAIEAGYDEHLAKPVDIDELLEMVKKLLAHDDSASSDKL